jgi:hypothetical protein
LKHLIPQITSKEIELYQEGELIGSIKANRALWVPLKFISTYSKLLVKSTVKQPWRGLIYTAEHTEDAHNNPGKHPNIDRLLDVIDNETTLSG